MGNRRATTQAGNKSPVRSPVAGHSLQNIYLRLLAAFGPQHWWPGKSPFEVMIGAILTQNTNWGNVERAIANLRAEGLLDPRRLAACHPRRLASLIKPSGYFNIKTRRLRNFLKWLSPRVDGDIVESLRSIRTPLLRKELLGVNGIGEETADSILLYALGRRVFVVDAYTRRFLGRHRLAAPDASYLEIQQMFERSLGKKSAPLYNECHALIVRLGKEICRPRSPLCEKCPLRPLLGEPLLK